MNNDLKDVLARLLLLDEQRPGDEILRGCLAARLAQHETETLPAETWSAYLTGQLDDKERAAVQRRLASSPALLREAASIVRLLEETEADPGKIPADLAAKASAIGRQAFATPGTAMPSALQRSLAVLGLQGGRVSGIRGALEIVLGQGRQTCEIMLDAAAGLVLPDSGAWSFTVAPALVTRSSSGAPAVAEGVREADAASMIVVADLFEGSRRIEIAIRGVEPENAPTVLVVGEDDRQPPVRLKASVETDPTSGSVRMLYEFENLPAGRFAVLICEPDPSPDAT